MDWHRYELMCQCWSVERENRPTFTQLKMRLKALEISMRRKQSKQAATRDSDALHEDTYINQDMGPQ